MQTKAVGENTSFWWVAGTSLYLLVFSINFASASPLYLKFFWGFAAILSLGSTIACALQGPCKFMWVFRFSTILWIIILFGSLVNLTKLMSLL